jgi:hypothetical protein
METEVKAPQPESSIYITASIYRAFVFVSCPSLFLHDNPGVVGRGLYIMELTRARVLTIPVKTPLNKMWLMGMMV